MGVRAETSFGVFEELPILRLVDGGEALSGVVFVEIGLEEARSL